MKRRLAGTLVVMALVLGLASAALAQWTCPTWTEDPYCGGFEFEVRLGGMSPAIIEGDFGLLVGGYFNLGAGICFTNLEQQGAIGGYAKIGLTTFDIIQVRFLTDDLCCSRSLLYEEFKLKIPLPVWFPCEGVVLPLHFGFRYSELSVYKDCARFSQDSAFLLGATGFLGSRAEVWVEYQLVFAHSRCGQSHFTDTVLPQMEFGFALAI